MCITNISVVQNLLFLPATIKSNVFWLLISSGKIMSTENFVFNFRNTAFCSHRFYILIKKIHFFTASLAKYEFEYDPMYKIRSPFAPFTSHTSDR